MEQNPWTKSVGIAASWLFVLVAVTTVLFFWLGPSLPLPVYNSIAVPVMLLVGLLGLPLSFSLAIAACFEGHGRSLGIKTLVGHLLFWAALLGWLSSSP